MSINRPNMLLNGQQVPTFFKASTVLTVIANLYHRGMTLTYDPLLCQNSNKVLSLQGVCGGAAEQPAG